MKDRLLRAMSHMPAGGIALHGTSYKKALSIAKHGLVDNGYLCVIPNPRNQYFKNHWVYQRLYSGSRLPKCDENEYFSRAMGSILFVSAYSFSNRHKEDTTYSKGEKNPQPAIMIFADWSQSIFNLLGNDIETPFSRLLPSFDTRTYFSFGKINCHPSPDKVCAIARLSHDDIKLIKKTAMSRASGRGPYAFAFIYEKLRKDALALKTLQLIEKLTYFENKPSEILLM
ncbi:Uncharacterised protein [uncultured archaeon]|nr:Uncharacterised protein [uncultured archaeon]